jgi:serine protease
MKRFFRVMITLLTALVVLLIPLTAYAEDLRTYQGGFSKTDASYVPDEIIVKFKPGTDNISQTKFNNAIGMSEVFSSRNLGFKVLKIPKDKTVTEIVAFYSKQATVEYAEPNYIYRITFTPNDPIYPYQWHFSQIGLGSAWDLDTTSPNYGGDPSIVVAVVDSGVAYENYGPYALAPDLASTHFWTNPGEIAGNGVDDDGNGYIDDVKGWDFVNSDAHPNDDDSHGTHVCGTIAQSTNNGLGVAGIAFNTTIMPLKVLDSDGSGTDADVAAAFEYAANKGAKIINFSAGGSASTTLANAVAYASNAGVLIVAAMGNTGHTSNTVSYPAAYDNYVLAVGATRYDQTRAYYSSYGPHIDVVAPGGDVTVDQNGDTYPDGVLQQTFNPDTQVPTDFHYYYFQGTSMATPHVSGVAALVWAKHLTWTAVDVRHAIETTAVDKGAVGRDNQYGWGLINAPSAVAS